jgi:hypothetical protein
MFECPVYSGPIWEALEGSINTMLQNERNDAAHVTLHAYQVLYNVDGAQFPRQHAKQILEIFQEIKRNMVYRRYVRCTSISNIRYNSIRILSHILNALEKLGRLRKFQGKQFDTIHALTQITRERINPTD